MSRNLLVTHPRCWSEAESNAWHRAIPDVMKAFTALAEAHPQYRKKLPTNLRSRVKILVRELAAFNGITYEEFNGIVHRLYYPKRDRVIAGQTIESSIPTNELTPDEARILESELYDLGARIGCPLSEPHSSS